jgi:hypothetical protein
LASSINGSSVTRAGGGGGSNFQDSNGSRGLGGSSIGGNGALDASNRATNGVINTGSGGGGSNASSPYLGGNGSTGIIIIRYPIA